ncbi:peptide ABC transporter substrate-binding protein [Kutzneria albida]|uniref:Oligopeptide/dipeptide ABC transporter periplasmic protein n=1 Tax=Kutzneria albida DSM 43870 TaxID=1449976 RepID=W5VZ56_9PSEU|nr:ABC transporter substrate-binding protein [Kutzneria albida]AHH94183.1 oligopeptide/dipeptide ABC transporter periplasmic protein [Kutzneria albida DSM 43870]
MGKRKMAAFVAVPAAVALLATGCGGGGSTAGADNSDGAVSIYGTEPQHPLTPGNTNEQGGIRVIDELYAGLVGFDPDNAKPYNLMAESITSSDAKVYDIKIKKGWKFHDGTEVKSHNFVDAWNYAALATNAQINADFFSQIQGFDEVHPDSKDAKPTAQTMSGLKVVGDYEFQVTLKAPFSVFPVKVGYEGFDPLPDVFFKDPKKFEQNPIGNGPMKFVSYTPNQDIKLTRFDGYQGQDAVHFKDLDIKTYSDLNTAYSDLQGGQLDFLDLMPPAALVGDKYKADLQGRALNTTLIDIDTIAVPYYVPGYNNPDLRKAISLSIDRDGIIKQVLNNAYTTANSYFASSLDGNVPNSCEFCKYDPEAAKAAFAKSGFSGKLTIASNSDGGHKEALTAVCNSITKVLGVSCDFVPQTSLGQFRSMITSHQATGMVRSDWSADYPSIENFLNPLYKTGASSNDSTYSNPAVDKLLEQADSTADKDGAIKLYQQAEALIAKDLPSIPLWSEKGTGGYSSKLSAAKLSWKRQPDLSSFRLAS